MPKKQRNPHVVEDVTAVLKGASQADLWRARNLRDNTWYARWLELGKLLKRQHTSSQVLKHVHGMINYASLYHYSWLAHSSEDSLEQVIRDLELK